MVGAADKKQNKLTKKNWDNLILFTDEKYNISALKKHISSNEYLFVLDLIKTKDKKKKIITLIAFKFWKRNCGDC